MVRSARPRENDDDDVHYYIGERLKLEGETENRKGIKAEIHMATPYTKSLGGENGEHKHGGDVGHRTGFAGRSPPFLGLGQAF